MVSKFTQLKPLLRRVVLRVHPDVLPHLHPTRGSQNEASLQGLFRLFDALRGRLEDAGSTSKVEPIAGHYVFDFWHEQGGGGDENEEEEEEDTPPPLSSPTRGGGATAVLLHRELRVDASLDERCKALQRAGKGVEYQAEWLNVGTGALATLGEGLGVFPKGAIQLSPDLRAHLVITTNPTGRGGSKRAAAAASMSPVSAAQAMRANLLARSPLQQGKRDTPSSTPTLDEARALVANPLSVFTLQQRRRRVEFLMALPNWLTVREEGGGGAPAAHLLAMRLRDTLVAHFDALHLYHGLWPTSGFVIGGGAATTNNPTTAYVKLNPLTHRVEVPMGYTEVDLVHRVRGAWGELVKGVKPKGGKKNKEAQPLH